MKHVLFALLVGLYVVVMGQNWTTYASALMIRAWVTHYRRLL